MSSNNPSSSKVESPAKIGEQHKEDEQPALGILEEDDEFEEFTVAGAHRQIFQVYSALNTLCPVLRR